MAGAASSSKSVDSMGRRQWDREEWEHKGKLAEWEELLQEQEAADQTEGRHKGPAPKRELLKHRDYKIALDKDLNKSKVVTKTTHASESGGYYCNVCDCVVKDSINFLDHVNGKKHQRNMGMSMKVKRASLDDVKARLEMKMQEKEEKKKEYNLQERLHDLQEEDRKMHEYRKQKQLEKRKRKHEETNPTDAGMDPDFASMMGFGSFATTGGKK